MTFSVRRITLLHHCSRTTELELERTQVGILFEKQAKRRAQVLCTSERNIFTRAQRIELAKQRGFDGGFLPHRKEDWNLAAICIVCELECAALAHPGANEVKDVGLLQLSDTVCPK